MAIVPIPSHLEMKSLRLLIPEDAEIAVANSIGQSEQP